VGVANRKGKRQSREMLKRVFRIYSKQTLGRFKIPWSSDPVVRCIPLKSSSARVL